MNNDFKIFHLFCKLKVLSFRFLSDSNKNPGTYGNNNDFNTTKEIPLLNWNFEIQQSGLFVKQYAMRHINTRSNYMKKVRINYLRQDMLDAAENQTLLAKYEESFEIEGEIEVT